VIAAYDQSQPGGGGRGLVNGTSHTVAQVSGLVALVAEGTARPLAGLVRGSDARIEAYATVLGRAARCR
jgi:hypothetical protein